MRRVFCCCRKTLPLAPKYWRVSQDSDEILECSVEGACKCIYSGQSRMKLSDRLLTWSSLGSACQRSLLSFSVQPALIPCMPTIIPRRHGHQLYDLASFNMGAGVAGWSIAVVIGQPATHDDTRYLCPWVSSKSMHGIHLRNVRQRTRNESWIQMCS